MMDGNTLRFRPLKPEEIEVKVKQLKESGAVVLLYKTARVDMDILDETVGPENWWDDYKEIKGNLYCGITIRTGAGCACKWDCGIESREDAEGNQKKGEASDAFKRAGFKWGIGRELYSAPFIWIKADLLDIRRNQNGKLVLFDELTVREIKTVGGKISALTVFNKKGEVAFRWPRSVS